jgi:hypothetical protein
VRDSRQRIRVAVGVILWLIIMAGAFFLASRLLNGTIPG